MVKIDSLQAERATAAPLAQEHVRQAFPIPRPLLSPEPDWYSANAAQKRSAQNKPAFGQLGQALRLATTPSATQGLTMAVSNGLAKIFRPVLENIIVGIMVVDVFAMWVPRVFGALTRGAFNYSPKTDPQAQGKTGWDLKKHVFKKRIDGLNWINAFEETMREVASGPALFVWPTLIFMAARRGAAKTGIELSYGPLTKLTDTLAHTLEQQGAKASDKSLKGALKQTIMGLFGDETMLKTKMPEHGKTYGEHLTQWTDRLVEAFWKQNPARSKPLSASAYESTLEHLKKDLCQTIEGYNRLHHAESRFYNYDKTLVKWLNRLDSKGLKKTIELDKEGKLPMIAAGKLVEHLDKWKDFLHQVDHVHMKAPSKPLVPIMEGLRQTLTIKKAALSLGTIGFTLLFLFRLVYWAQSHNNYEANRLIPLDELQIGMSEHGLKANRPASSAKKEKHPASAATPAKTLNFQHKGSLPLAYTPLIQIPTAYPSASPALALPASIPTAPSAWGASPSLAQSTFPQWYMATATQQGGLS